jgi:hypothetical protein
MTLICNHKLSAEIIAWLYDNCDIKGNEDHLVNELFTSFLGSDEIIKLEKHLSGDDNWIEKTKKRLS